MGIDFSDVEYLTFDCYGTLIDWETGIFESLLPIVRRHGWTGDKERLLEQYATFETELEAGPFLPYREVLRRVVDGFGASLGFQPTDDERDAFAGSVGNWPPFDDSREALAALAGRFKLVVLSNVDDDLFDGSNKRLGAPFHAVLTAQRIGSYKPDLKNFYYAIAKLGGNVDRIVHVAQSLYHDIKPARQIGLRTTWINRRFGKDGSGATPEASETPDLEFTSLEAFVDYVEKNRVNLP